MFCVQALYIQHKGIKQEIWSSVEKLRRMGHSLDSRFLDLRAVFEKGKSKNARVLMLTTATCDVKMYKCCGMMLKLVLHAWDLSDLKFYIQLVKMSCKQMEQLKQVATWYCRNHKCTNAEHIIIMLIKALNKIVTLFLFWRKTAKFEELYLKFEEVADWFSVSIYWW